MNELNREVKGEVNRSMMKQVLNEADQIEPIVVINGTPIYDFNDAVTLNNAELMEIKQSGKRVDLGDREMNADGITYKRTQKRHAAVDPKKMFLNRYRVVNGKGASKFYEVVTDYRSIREQENGQISVSHVPVMVVAKGEEGSIVIKERKTVAADEFVNEFKRELDTESMIKIYKATGELKSSIGIDQDKLEL